MHGSHFVLRPPRPGEVSRFKGVGKLDNELWASTSCDQANPEYYGTCAAPASASTCRVQLLLPKEACACGTRPAQACELLPARAAMPGCPAETARSRRSFETEEEAVMAYDVVGLARDWPQADLHRPISTCAQRQPAWCSAQLATDSCEGTLVALSWLLIDVYCIHWLCALGAQVRAAAGAHIDIARAAGPGRAEGLSRHGGAHPRRVQAQPFCAAAAGGTANAAAAAVVAAAAAPRAGAALAVVLLVGV